MIFIHINIFWNAGRIGSQPNFMQSLLLKNHPHRRPFVWLHLLLKFGALRLRSLNRFESLHRFVLLRYSLGFYPLLAKLLIFALTDTLLLFAKILPLNYPPDYCGWGKLWSSSSKVRCN